MTPSFVFIYFTLCLSLTTQPTTLVLRIVSQVMTVIGASFNRDVSKPEKSCIKTGNVVSKTRNFTAKTRNCASKTEEVYIKNDEFRRVWDPRAPMRSQGSLLSAAALTSTAAVSKRVGVGTAVRTVSLVRCQQP